ncbi:MAG: hypothetical protein P9M14_13535 [Candidatus Alcyoniella australis]|nr:hypothetical protein [Candidatus Alcyoniella australis]
MAQTIAKQIEIEILAKDRTRGLLSRINALMLTAQRRAQELGQSAGKAAETLGALGAGLDAAAVQRYGEGLVLARSELETLDQRVTALYQSSQIQFSLLSETVYSVGRSFDAVGNTFISGFADTLIYGSWDAERALKGLGRTILTTLLGALSQWAVKQLVIKSLESAQIALLAVEQGQVAALTLSYNALAAAKLIALGPAGLLLHGGGAVMHEGGPVRRAHSGLRADEVGPFILQRGEFVMQRSTVQSIGSQRMAYINQTGQLPQSSPTINITVNAGPGSDGRRIGRDLAEELSWQSRTGRLQLDRRAIRG